MSIKVICKDESEFEVDASAGIVICNECQSIMDAAHIVKVSDQEICPVCDAEDNFTEIG